jgi:hypothetical protein
VLNTPGVHAWMIHENGTLPDEHGFVQFSTDPH